MNYKSTYYDNNKKCNNNNSTNNNNRKINSVDDIESYKTEDSIEHDSDGNEGFDSNDDDDDDESTSSCEDDDEEEDDDLSHVEDDSSHSSCSASSSSSSSVDNHHRRRRNGNPTSHPEVMNGSSSLRQRFSGEEQQQEQRQKYGFTASRGHPPPSSQHATNGNSLSPGEESIRKKKRLRVHIQRQPCESYFWSCNRKFQRSIIHIVNHDFFNACSSLILITSFLVWLILVLSPELGSSVDSAFMTRFTTTTRESAKLRNRQRAEAGRSHRDNRPFSFTKALTNPLHAFDTILDPRIKAAARQQQVKRSVEDLQPGCERAPWQEYNFPNCNTIHEMDLADYFAATIQKKEQTKSPTGEPLGYLSKGLWRTVWSILPTDVMKHPVVIKMMKEEHEADSRNLDRHRRDALVMERLTSSPYVVDIFGHCGNSIVTEYISLTLDDVIYSNSKSEDKRNNNTENVNIPSRETPQGRLRLALDVARGVWALHNIEGGPIVHTDLQSKQFLVTSSGTVKINDFNRCRFVTHKNATNTSEPCSFRIPTAPGKSRAPEEYAYDDLTEKLDIFSVANIYYEILSGEDPWYGWSTTEVKKTVQKGYKPLVEEEFRRPGTLDEMLQNITLRAYEFDPSLRISAAELVEQLETIIRSLSLNSSSTTTTRT